MKTNKQPYKILKKHKQKRKQTFKTINKSTKKKTSNKNIATLCKTHKIKKH